MKSASFFVVGVVIVGLYLVTLTGCSTDTPGAKDTLGTYSTMINGAPDKVTDAAQKAAADLKLSDIVGNSTKVDGRVSAKTAQGELVIIEISQSGDGVSKMSIRVGMTGDDAVSKQLIDKTKSHMSWF